jgi:hypothetical protein
MGYYGRQLGAKEPKREFGGLCALGFVRVKGGLTAREEQRANREEKGSCPSARHSPLAISANKRQPAYKPGSVWRGRVSPAARDGHSSRAAVAGRLRRPTRATARRRARKHCCLQSPLFGLAPGGACHAPDVAARAVRSYRTLSPLPREFRALRARLRGGLLSVALSLGSPPPDVIRRRVSMEPGLSSAFGAAAIRPTGYGRDR